MESKKNVNVMSDLPSGVTRGPIGQKGPFCGVSFRPEDDVSKICVESNNLEEQVVRLRKLVKTKDEELFCVKKGRDFLGKVRDGLQEEISRITKTSDERKRELIAIVANLVREKEKLERELAELSSTLSVSMHGEKVCQVKVDRLESELNQYKGRVDGLNLELRTKSSIVRKLNRCIKELSR